MGVVDPAGPEGAVRNVCPWSQGQGHLAAARNIALCLFISAVFSPELHQALKPVRVGGGAAAGWQDGCAVQ